MMEKVDANMSGRIDFTEFLMLMKSKEIMAK
jgi:Ca2+-binding EF-hand superfamily protein